MHPNSPYYHYDPDSIGWLHRRHRQGMEICKADIVRLIRVDAAHASDPVLQAYLLPALEDRLNGKRGRPAMTMGKLWRYPAAYDEYVERLAEFHRERKAGKRMREAYDEEPSIQVAQQVADDFRLGCTGRAFLNRISQLKRPNFDVNAMTGRA